MSEKNTSPGVTLTTPIDEAWAAAQSDGDDPTDAAAAAFIDAILSTALICPVWGDPEEDAETFSPRMQEMDGKPTLILFDTEDRLSEYVGEPVAFVALPGGAFFELAADGGAQIALNPDIAPSSTFFETQAVEAIADVANAAQEELEIGGEGGLTIDAPENLSEELLEALSGRILGAPTLISEAWLFSAQRSPEEGGDTLTLLGMCPAPGATDAGLRAFAAEMAQLGGRLLPQGVNLDVILLQEGHVLLESARRVGLGLATQGST